MIAPESEMPELFGAGGGGKGGGGDGHTATEDPDTLTDRQEARIKEVLSEGECGGPNGAPVIVNGMKSVALGDGNSFTRVQNPDNTYNYKNFKFYILPGTQDQSHVPNFDASESTIAVGVRVRKLTPWTHTVTNDALDALRVEIRFPTMRTVNKKTGDTHGATVNIKIELRQFGGSYVQVINDVIKGKATSAYVRPYSIDLPKGFAPWDIRVTRITADSTSEAILDETWVDSYTEVQHGKLRHPNSVVAAVAIDAEQFGTIPVRTYEIYGLLIKVPKNYNPVTGVYATTGAGTTNGIWDGTFKVAYSSNPAWCFYDMATNTRYGLGRYLEADKIDKGALYTIGKYCDQLVADGRGGQERRFTCNLYLQERAQALEVLKSMASIFRAMLYYSGGWLVPTQDVAATSIAHQFGFENIIGRFTYGVANRTARHSCAYVTWNNHDNFGKPEVEYVEDADDVRERGIIPLTVIDMGQASRGQAHRLGKWMLISERLDRTNRWQTGQEGMHLRPGKVVETHDPYRSGKSLSGRLVAATTTTLTLDKEIVIESGKTYAVSTLKTDGTVDRRAITDGIGARSVLHVTPAYSAAPDARTQWVLAVSDLQPEQWRLIGVTPKDLATVDLIGLEYNQGKWDAIEKGITLEDPPTSTLPSPANVQPPGWITLKVVPVLEMNGSMTQSILVSWQASKDRYVKTYGIWHRHEQGNWGYLGTSARDIDIKSVATGYHEVMVRTINVLDKQSLPRLVGITVETANPIHPARVSGLELTGQGNDVVSVHADFDFSWNENSPSTADHLGFIGVMVPDPWFKTYEVTIWAVTNVRLRSETTTIPHYRYTLAKNRQDNKGKPLNRIRIEVRVINKIRELLKASKLTVINPPPKAATEDTLNPSFRVIDLSWNSTDDTDLDKSLIYRYKGIPPSSALPAAAKVIATKSRLASSHHDANLDEDLTYAYWLVHYDTFGQPSALLYFGYAQADEVRPPETDLLEKLFNDLLIATVLFNPNGGHIQNPTTVKLSCPKLPKLPIYYTTGVTTPADPTTGDNLHTTAGIVLTATTIIKARVIHPFSWPGVVSQRTFTINASGVVAPSFTPASGVYTTVNGTKNVALVTPTAADALFYTKTLNGTAPATPTHTGGTATGGTIKLPGKSYTIVLPRGRTRVKVIGYKSGWTDSAVTDADFTIYKASGSNDPGGTGGEGGGGGGASGKHHF